MMVIFALRSVDIFRTDAEISHLNGPAAIKELQVQWSWFTYTGMICPLNLLDLFLSRSQTLRRKVEACHWTLWKTR